MDDARSRWRAEHRRRRIRTRKLAPWKRAAVIALFVAAAAFAVLAVVADIMWFTGTLACLFAGLRLHGLTFGEIFATGGSPDAYISGDGGGTGDGGC
jgi:protein-S-isoprenylcysteine O-methyltransferase Ste14